MVDHLARPELYVPLSVRFLTGGTGTRLLERFGRDGPLVWAAFLAACKQERPAGTMRWASEGEAWNKLGLTGYEPDFSFDEFLQETGRMKLTRRHNVRRTRAGRVQDVRITVWERWTHVDKREAERVRKSRIRAQSGWDTKRTEGGTGNGQEADLDLEVEVEKELTHSPRTTTTPASDDFDFQAADPPQRKGGAWSTELDIPRLGDAMPTLGVSD